MKSETVKPERTSAAGPVGVALSGLVALATAMGIGRFAFTPLLPMMQDDAGLSVAAGGWLASVNYAGYLLGALTAMRLPIGPVAAVRTGLAAVGVTTLMMGCTDSFAAWAVLRTVAGAASAWVLIFASAWCLERLAVLRRPLLGGAVFAGVGFGIALTGLICLALMRFELRSSRAWMVLGLLSFGLTAAVWRTFTSQSDGADHAPRRAPHAMRWDRESLRMVLCYGAFGFGYIIPATFLPAMAKRIIHDATVFGWSWPVFGFAAFLSTLTVSLLQRRFGNRTLWIAAQLIMAAGVALPALWSGITAIMLAALLAGGTFMVITMVGIQEARTAGGAQAPALIAAMTAAFAAGQVAGPLAVSVLADAPNGLSISLLSAAALLTATAVALARKAQMRL